MCLFKGNTIIFLLLVALSLPLASSFTKTFSTFQGRFLNKNNNISSSSLQMENDASSTKSEKKIILIRHGCTFMNEYLDTQGTRWGDANFTDIFHPSQHDIYKDSPLSGKGKQQAQDLHDFFHAKDGKDMIQNIDIVAVSPLTRTLETMEIGVLPHLRNVSKNVPIVALPLATERVYLISDHGKCRLELAQKYTFVDFEKEFEKFEREWWFTTHEHDGDDKDDTIHSFTSLHKDSYQEWRPSDENQTYSCHGEPDDLFEARMMELYKWLESRNENVICLICHWGVLDWLTGNDFKNCEVKQVSFSDIQRKVEEKM